LIGQGLSAAGGPGIVHPFGLAILFQYPWLKSPTVQVAAKDLEGSTLPTIMAHKQLANHHSRPIFCISSPVKTVKPYAQNFESKLIRYFSIYGNLRAIRFAGVGPKRGQIYFLAEQQQDPSYLFSFSSKFLRKLQNINDIKNKSVPFFIYQSNKQAIIENPRTRCGSY